MNARLDAALAHWSYVAPLLTPASNETEYQAVGKLSVWCTISRNWRIMDMGNSAAGRERPGNGVQPMR